MARGSKKRKRPLKGLLAWIGLALLALVAAKKAVERFMGHESAEEDNEGLGGVQRVEHIEPDNEGLEPLLDEGLNSASDIVAPKDFEEASED